MRHDKSDDLAREILDALGISLSGVKSVDVSLRCNEVAEMTITRLIDSDDWRKIKVAVGKYELRRAE